MPAEASRNNQGSTAEVEHRRSRLLRSYIESVYRSGTVTDSTGNIHHILPSAVPPEEGETLRELVVAEQASATLEVGLAYGLSTLFICEGLLANGPTGKHVAIDPLEGILFQDAGLATLDAAGVASMVEFLREPSDLALPRLLGSERHFDLVFIDGAHHFDNAFVDCFYSVKLLRPGGVLVVDDVWMPAIDLIVRYLVTNFGCRRIRHVPASSTAAPHQPGAGARLAILRTPGQGELPERPWDSFVPFTPPVPQWLQQLEKRFARYDRDF
jgi:predicted O-methyltransferase YrrM